MWPTRWPGASARCSIRTDPSARNRSRARVPGWSGSGSRMWPSSWSVHQKGACRGPRKAYAAQSGVRVSAHLAITERHRVPEARIGLSEEGGRRNVQGHLPRPPEPAALRAAPIRVEFDQQPTASHLLSLRRAAVTRGDQDRSFVLPGAVFDNGRFLALAPAEVRAIGKRGRGQAQDKKRRNGRTPHPRTLGAPRLRGQPDRS